VLGLSQKDIERALLKNPERVPGKYTEKELELVKIAKGYVSYEELRKKPMQTREVLTTKTYQYWSPFNYPNIKVDLGRRLEVDGNKTGAEFNTDGTELDIPPYGAITIEEDEPIVAVTIIGSACVSPGYVILEAEPMEWKYPRTGIKMLAQNLWGVHVVYGGVWSKGVDESQYHNFPGLSSAHFEIPESRKVTIKGGSRAVHGAAGSSGDAHYCFRIIRVIVRTWVKKSFFYFYMSL